MDSGRKVGFIGLGKMGLPMASRLVSRGFVVTAFDADPDARAHWTKLSSSAGADLMTAAPSLDFLVTMLPNGEVVRNVLVGGNTPLLDKLRADCIVIDMSSSSPKDTSILAEETRLRCIALVDAPVSGGVSAAAEGTLTIMAGTSSEEALDRSLPLLEALGRTVLRVGPSGSGHAAKALNNAVAAAIFAATSEALAVGVQFGLTEQDMLSVINAASGASSISQHLFPTQVLNNRFSQGFELALMAKDASIAAEMASAGDYPCVVLTASAGQWMAARDKLPNADFTEMHRFVFDRQFAGRSG